MCVRIWNDTFVGFLSFCLMHFREAYGGGGIMLKHLSTLWTSAQFCASSQPFFSVPFCLFIGVVWAYFDIKRISKPFYFYCYNHFQIVSESDLKISCSLNIKYKNIPCKIWLTLVFIFTHPFEPFAFPFNFSPTSLFSSR